MATETIPVIDLGPFLAGEEGALDRTAKELRFALTEIGFYFIVNHGVAQSLIDDAFAAAKRFHDQPLERKLEIRLNQYNIGYLPMRGGTTRHSALNANNKPNVNEAFFSARDLSADHPDVLAGKPYRCANKWPPTCPASAKPASPIRPHSRSWPRASCRSTRWRSICPRPTSTRPSPIRCSSCA